MSDPTPTPDKKNNDALRKIIPNQDDDVITEDATILFSLDTSYPIDDVIRDLVKMKNVITIAEELNLEIDEDAGTTGSSGKDVEITVPPDKLEDFLRRFANLKQNAPDDINIQIFSEEQREIAERFETAMNHFYGEKKVYIDDNTEDDDDENSGHGQDGPPYGDLHDGYDYTGIGE